MLLPFAGRTDLERRVDHQHRRPGLGGQPGLADPRRRRDLRGLAAALCRRPSRASTSRCSRSSCALILRPVASSSAASSTTRAGAARWDWALFIGGFVPALIFGVAIGNVLQGVPFRFDADMRIFYDGSFFGLLNPFALLCGLVSVAMLVMHGSAWLQLKTQGPVAERARAYGSVAALADRRAVCAGRRRALVLRRRLSRHERDAAGRPVESAAEDGRGAARAPGSPTTRRIRGCMSRRCWAWPVRCWRCSGCGCGARC